MARHGHAIRCWMKRPVGSKPCARPLARNRFARNVAALSRECLSQHYSRTVKARGGLSGRGCRFTAICASHPAVAWLGLSKIQGNSLIILPIAPTFFCPSTRTARKWCFAQSCLPLGISLRILAQMVSQGLRRVSNLAFPTGYNRFGKSQFCRRRLGRPPPV